MSKELTDKTASSTAPKSFMTAGPTLHYSHANVTMFWLMSVIVFFAACVFWAKILTGSLWSFNITYVTKPEFFRLGRFVLSPLSIFEYPHQILVLGLLMGLFGVVPSLVSQLLSFRYSLPFIAAVMFIAGLPLFALILLISCVAAACRPLRFRSRIVAIALCMSPQLFYWAYFGGASRIDPLKWGFSLAPWITAWLVGLVIAAVVLGIGHFTRYRPGFIWLSSFIVLAGAFVTFQTKIGFAELDYRWYVAKNNPEEIGQFHDHGITESLDQTITNPVIKKYLSGFFYPTEPILLREVLKSEIQSHLIHDRWPSWLLVPEELRYQAKRDWLQEQYSLFIKRRPNSKRMPIALYYKAILSEYSPDIVLLGQKEMLHFYSDYPQRRAIPIWYQLYEEFSDSSESLEARWRIAVRLAGQGNLEKADELAAEAIRLLAEKLKTVEETEPKTGVISILFKPPASTIMGRFKLAELQQKLITFRSLISEQNRTENTESRGRLAKFVILNPYSPDYLAQLDELLAAMKDNDPLRDNVLLAKVMLISDPARRAEQLKKLSQESVSTDGGIQAQYELGVLNVRMYKEHTYEKPEERKIYLQEARTILTDFVNGHPDSIFTVQAKSIIESLPPTE